VCERLDLTRSARPFTRCLRCNGTLAPIDKAEAMPRLPPRVAATFERFSACAGCGQVYWEGSHWRRMQALVDDVLAGAAPGAAPAPPEGDAPPATSHEARR
jgi:uncharacterized protein with PIN domain